MKKTSKKIEENFLTSNIFLFESYECLCEIVALPTNINSEAEPALKISPDPTNIIKFAFGSKVGLVRLNEDGSIAESNILGKLASIENGCIEEYISFFKRNGFLLPVSLNKSEVITISLLQTIVDRIRATLELMSTITDMSRTSYEKIIRMIFYHLFAPIVSIETKEGKYKYISDRHRYSSFLEEHKYASRDSRLNDIFNNSEFLFTDNINTFSLDADFVDSVLTGNPKESKFENPLFQNVFTAYCSPRIGKPKSMLLINDFVFHYLYDVGIIEYVDLHKTHYVNSAVNKNGFSDEMKSNATLIAKLILKEEIEHNLRRVRPTYNISKLEPAWKIDSLLSALYFGLFYMRPTTENYRRCANPKCGEFFLAPVSSRKKKYCCTACMNRDMAARKRARDKSKLDV